MPRRSNARYLAPLALVAFLIALAAVVSSSGGEQEDTGATTAPAERSEDARQGDETRDSTSRRGGRRTYVVHAGDTPSTIAEKTGVSLSTLEELNPEIDPQQLSPGQRLRLRR